MQAVLGLVLDRGRHSNDEFEYLFTGSNLFNTGAEKSGLSREQELVYKKL